MEDPLSNQLYDRGIRGSVKTKFTLEFVQQKAIQLKNTCLPLNMIDLGGQIDEEKKLIAFYATHGLILFRDITQITSGFRFYIVCSLHNRKLLW